MDVCRWPTENSPRPMLAPKPYLRIICYWPPQKLCQDYSLKKNNKKISTDYCIPVPSNTPSYFNLLVWRELTDHL